MFYSISVYPSKMIESDENKSMEFLTFFSVLSITVSVKIDDKDDSKTSRIKIKTM